MKLHYITYNGTTSKSLGIYVSRGSSFDAAAPDYVSYQIPGKNGDLQINNDRYLNIDVTYPVFIPGGFESSVQAVRNWMRSADGYAKLSDTYDTAHFRLGRGKDVMTFTPAAQNVGANFELLFDCKPQRWLVTGDTTLNITSGDTITNPTQFPAAPTFWITNPSTGGSITFANAGGRTYVMSITGSRTGRITCDCETMNIYAGATNYNWLLSGDFPVFEAGAGVTITFSGITKLEVKPRWWEL